MCERWWDEPELILLAHTGDVALAEQFAAWCQQSTANLMSVIGLSEDDINAGLTNFVRDDGSLDRRCCLPGIGCASCLISG